MSNKTLGLKFSLIKLNIKKLKFKNKYLEEQQNIRHYVLLTNKLYIK